MISSSTSRAHSLFSEEPRPGRPRSRDCRLLIWQHPQMAAGCVCVRFSLCLGAGDCGLSIVAGGRLGCRRLRRDSHVSVWQRTLTRSTRGGRGGALDARCRHPPVRVTAVAEVRDHVRPLGLHSGKWCPSCRSGLVQVLLQPPVGHREEVGVSDGQLAAERGVGGAGRVEAQGVRRSSW